MTKKECFIKLVEKEIFDKPNVENDSELFNNAKDYFMALKDTKEKEKQPFTENGKVVLQCMKDNKDNFNNLFKAKNIAEILGLSSKTVSGALRKIVTDGYIEKMEGNPVIYSLTDKGIEIDLTNY